MLSKSSWQPTMPNGAPTWPPNVARWISARMFGSVVNSPVSDSTMPPPVIRQGSVHSVLPLGSLTQPSTGSHESSVQVLSSSQRELLSVFTQPSTGSQRSSVQTLSSSQRALLSEFTQPSIGSQLSSVQTLLSS